MKVTVIRLVRKKTANTIKKTRYETTVSGVTIGEQGTMYVDSYMPSWDVTKKSDEIIIDRNLLIDLNPADNQFGHQFDYSLPAKWQWNEEFINK